MLRFGSVCPWIEAASVAWEPLGWLPQFYSEIEPFPCAVLHEHWYGGPSIFSFTLTDEESVMRINRPYYSPQRYIAPPDPDFDEIEDEEPAF